MHVHVVVVCAGGVVVLVSPRAFGHRISAFMLIGALNGGVTVGEVEKSFRPQVVELINEMVGAVSAKTGLRFEEGAAERLCAYARSVAHFPTAVKVRNASVQWC